MQTTPNLGMVIPSGDGDPFDEMVFVTALLKVDTFAGKVGELAYAEVSANVSAPNAAWGDLIALPAITLDGATKIRLECFLALVEPPQVAGGAVLGQFFYTVGGSWGQIYISGAGASGGGNSGYEGFFGAAEGTPPAGTHTFRFQGQGVSGAGVIGSLASGYQALHMRASRVS